MPRGTPRPAQGSAVARPHPIIRDGQKKNVPIAKSRRAANE